MNTPRYPTPEDVERAIQRTREIDVQMRGIEGVEVSELDTSHWMQALLEERSEVPSVRGELRKKLTGLPPDSLALVPKDEMDEAIRQHGGRFTL